MMRGSKTVLALTVCLALAAGACGGGGKGVKLGKQHKVGDQATFAIAGADQTSNGKTVKIPEVYLKGTKGYVAIHVDDNGSPGQNTIGVSELLPAGESKDIKVKLNKQLTTTQDVWPMLHVEDNNDTTYDYPSYDKEAMANNAVVTTKIRITIR